MLISILFPGNALPCFTRELSKLQTSQHRQTHLHKPKRPTLQGHRVQVIASQHGLAGPVACPCLQVLINCGSACTKAKIATPNHSLRQNYGDLHAKPKARSTREARFKDCEFISAPSKRQQCIRLL